MISCEDILRWSSLDRELKKTCSRTSLPQRQFENPIFSPPLLLVVALNRKSVLLRVRHLHYGPHGTTINPAHIQLTAIVLDAAPGEPEKTDPAYVYAEFFRPTILAPYISDKNLSMSQYNQYAGGGIIGDK